MKKLNYLCLQATREGQASHAHVHEIIDGLRRRGWEVELFEPRYARSDVLPGSLGRSFEFLLAQIKFWRKNKGDSILYIRTHFATFPTALLAKLFFLPVVQEVNGPYEDLFIAWPWTRRFAFLFKWLIRTQLKWADSIIVVTDRLREWILQEVGQKPVFIIPNGANINLFHPEAVSKYEIPMPYAVFFGALAPWQGINTLIEAVNLSKWPERVKLLIVGDGIERSKVEEASKYNPRIIYLGKIPYQEVPGIVANSIAGLSPQNNIGGRSNMGLFPLKLFETLACGVPIIVTDFSGQADLVRKHNIGLVIPPDDPKALVEAITFLYNNPSQREAMGRRGREVVEREHSWDKRAADTEAVLIGVLKGVNK